MVSPRHATNEAIISTLLSVLGSGSERSGGSSPLPRTDAGQTQMLRHVRLQLLGMGALTVWQVAPASAPEQSNEPCPGVGSTHDGGGGSWTQPPPASEYADPAGQTPASGDVAMHP